MQVKEFDRNDSEARGDVITSYLPHVKRIVHRMAVHLPASVELDELVNAGIIGLIQAVDRYDPTRDNKFITYATFRIKGAVLSELRSRDHLGRSVRKKVRELDSVYSMLERRLGREVNDQEVADEMGIDLDKMYQIKKMSGISFISFEEIGCSSKEEKDSLMSSMFNGGVKDALTMTRLKELQQAIADAIDKLPEKEKLVIALYYQDGLTMKEAGKVLNITESRVSQIHSQAVIHLRRKLKIAGYVKDRSQGSG